MRRLLQFILKILATRVISRYKPTVVGITGSVGKTLAKEAMYAVLSRKFRVRKTEENFNNEIGVPLTILGISPRDKRQETRDKSFFAQLDRLSFVARLLSAVWLAWGWPRSSYPEILVLELAADKPGDIEYLVDIAKPKIGVVTAVGELPVHVEFYASPQAVAREKARLVERLPSEGLAILNYDDQTVLDMKEKSKAKVMTFGFSKEADIWASDVSYFTSEPRLQVTGYRLQVPTIGGLSFKLNYGSSFVPARVNNMIGRHQLYGVLAAAAVGLHLGVNLISIAESLENLDLPYQRMALKLGIKNTIVIDDTYNASPLSVHAALDVLADLAKARESMGGEGRRIAVLGDMRELGKYELEAHRTIGNLAGERCDVLVTVGAAGKIMADSAANQMPKGAIFSFNTSEAAGPKVQEIIQEGDIVLVKGSRAMEMEKIVEEIAFE